VNAWTAATILRKILRAALHPRTFADPFRTAALFSSLYAICNSWTLGAMPAAEASLRDRAETQVLALVGRSTIPTLRTLRLPRAPPRFVPTPPRSPRMSEGERGYSRLVISKLAFRLNQNPTSGSHETIGGIREIIEFRGRFVFSYRGKGVEQPLGCFSNPILQRVFHTASSS
jgi:hypothetical protein